MMNIKELSKKSKGALVDLLKSLKPDSQDDKEIITYTLNSLEENSRNVTKPELIDIFKDLTCEFPLPVENQAKKVIKKKTEKEAEEEILNILDEENEEELEKEEVVENKVKKVAKVEKKKEVKKDTKKETNLSKPKTMEIAIEFPDSFKSSIGQVTLREDIKDIKDFSKKIENGDNLVLGVFWNKRTLKQFEYDVVGILGKDEYPKEFPNDLDLLDVYYASDKVVYAISIYTECHYTFVKDTFNIDPETGLRYSSGLEFQVYENQED